MFVHLFILGLASGASIGLLSYGLSLIHSVTGTLHLMHAGTVMLSGAAFIWAADQLPLALAVLIGCVVGIVVGLCVDFAIYRTLERRSAANVSIMLAGLATLLLVGNITLAIVGGETMRPPASVSAMKSEILGISVSTVRILLFAMLAVLVLLHTLTTRYSQIGQKVLAVNMNPVRAQTVGINVAQIRLMVYVIASFLAALAALDVAVSSGINPGVGLQTLLFALCGSVVGGLDRPATAAVGGLAMGVIPSISTMFISPSWQAAVVLCVLVLALLVPRRQSARRV